MIESKVTREANPYFGLLTMERIEDLPSKKARFVFEPLPRGFGSTLGNSLRRVLLSSVPGSAITHVEIAGVPHEFATLPGIVEDTSELLFNLRKVKVKIVGNVNSAILTLKVSGEHRVTAADFEQNPEVEIISPQESYLCAITDKKRALELKAHVSRGVGFVLAADLKRKEAPIGEIALDSNFSPVERVAFSIENTRVGKETDFERLVLVLECNGSKTPDESLGEAASQLNSYYEWVRAEQNRFLGIEEEMAVDEELMRKLEMPIDELGLSSRAYNCLSAARISTINELSKYTAERLMGIKNFGEKSLVEIVDKLAELGLFLAEKED
ncbi:MAG: DNA-directed RNA polymerase subunit alpha [Candidatus Riflebacteria bacterium RBG_13_59_9]|nr:MAG: DNA-directed RNA polymerase subunit alpha [Candidatus Riflebacteria bacterium RBG_13_59_9]